MTSVQFSFLQCSSADAAHEQGWVRRAGGRGQARHCPEELDVGMCYLDRQCSTSWHNPIGHAEVFTANKNTPTTDSEWNPDTERVNAFQPAVGESYKKPHSGSLWIDVLSGGAPYKSTHAPLSKLRLLFVCQMVKCACELRLQQPLEKPTAVSVSSSCGALPCLPSTEITLRGRHDIIAMCTA